MIMLKFKVAFKSIAFNHMLVVNDYLGKWKEFKLLNRSVSIRDNLIKKSENRDINDYINIDKDKKDVDHDNGGNNGKNYDNNDNNDKINSEDYENNTMDISLKNKVKEL